MRDALLLDDTGGAPVGSHERFSIAWTAAAVFHDVGYVLEVIDPEQNQAEITRETWLTTRNDLNATLRHQLLFPMRCPI